MLFLFLPIYIFMFNCTRTNNAEISGEINNKTNTPETIVSNKPEILVSITEEVFLWEISGNGVIIIGYTGECTDVQIPSQIQELPVVGIGAAAFVGRDYYSGHGGSLFFGDAMHQLTSVIIPDSVTSIGPLAFGGNRLTSVIIPDNVIEIGERAFSTNEIMSLVIPDNVTRIRAGAFENNRLTSVSIGNSVRDIGPVAFYNNELTSIIIPMATTRIGYRAFAENKIIEVTIPNSAAYSHPDAFDSEVAITHKE
jgi:hypothetical protein